MPTGRVKRFDSRRKFGFIVADDGGEVYVHGDRLGGEALHPGDLVEFELDPESGRRPAAQTVTVTTRAPEGTPVGQVSGPPPTWDELEDVAREERQRRRGRRR